MNGATQIEIFPKLFTAFMHMVPLFLWQMLVIAQVVHLALIALWGQSTVQKGQAFH